MLTVQTSTSHMVMCAFQTIKCISLQLASQSLAWRKASKHSASSVLVLKVKCAEKVRSVKRAEAEKIRKADKAAKEAARKEKEARSYGTIFQVVQCLYACVSVRERTGELSASTPCSIPHERLPCLSFLALSQLLYFLTSLRLLAKPWPS